MTCVILSLVFFLRPPLKTCAYNTVTEARVPSVGEALVSVLILKGTLSANTASVPV